MAFAVMVEALNIRVRSRMLENVKLRQPYR